MQQRATLLEAFGSSEADLIANRQGTLTREQHQRLLAATSGDAVFMAGFAIFFAAVMYGVLFLIVDSGKVFDFQDGISLTESAILFAAGGLPTAGILWGIYTVFIHRRARNANRVKMVQGPVTPGVLRYKRAVVHQISLDGQTFDMTPQAHQLFESESSYRVYYEPGTLSCLSSGNDGVIDFSGDVAF